MLQVTSQDISTLNDTDLRLLIGYLCEAEVTSKGLITHGVTYGGHQNAKDGGIDVRVNYDVENWIQGFIPRENTGFQVKKPEMPPSEIPKEMAPKDILRDSIRDLVELKGAYIIISSQSSTADSALKLRREAMEAVIDTHFPQGEIFLDFYDSQRVASWVNTYPSLIAWVRKKIGRDIVGWKGYENWAYSPNGIDEEYFLDNNVRFLKKGSNSESVSIEDGLNRLRIELKGAKSITRLVGLSGVGKTRFVQALFDGRIGENALEKSLVLYTDIGDNPNPSPKQMLEQLLLKSTKTYLIIDNCPPDLHIQVTSILKAASSHNISLLTIEYDVKDETKEETEVYHLENASENVISKLILERYDFIDNSSARHIAKLSGGNFRIANALASVVSKGENLSLLPDRTIFSRLFRQRNEENNNLEIVAEVCSLVYSFNIDTTSSNNTEIMLLSELAGMSVKEFLRNVNELESRNLIQKRGVYRAFLPHALANRLAVSALGSIPLYELKDIFENKAEWRLYRSFSKRLSYLHFSDIAMKFAEEWLKESELLIDLSIMDDKKMHLLECVAPLNVALTLKTLEEINEKDYADYFYSRDNPHYSRLSRLIIHLAYDPQYFERSVKLLIKMVLKEREKETVNSIYNLLKPLFHLYLSHTHASVNQKLEIVNKLIKSKNKKELVLGVNLLDEMLESWNFSSHGLTGFGGHIRDLGYHPKLGKEIEDWYKKVVEYCLEQYSIESISNEISSILANNLRGIWSQRHCFEVVEYICLSMFEKGLWAEGWISIKSILKYDSKRMDQSLINRLNILEQRLRPNDLEEHLHLFLTKKRFQKDIIEAFDGNISEVENKIDFQAKLLGKFLSENTHILTQYLPNLLIGETQYLVIIGSAIADNFDDKKELWNIIKKNLDIINEGYNPFLIGVLSRLEPNFIDEIFNELIELNNIKILINLQNCFFADLLGIDRLKLLITSNALPENYLFYLRGLRFNDDITPQKFIELINEIKICYDDPNLIAHFLYELILFKKEHFLVYKPIIEMMHDILICIFSKEIKSSSSTNYEFGEIIKYIYSLPETKNKFIELATLIINGISNFRIYDFRIDGILEALVITQPKEFLELTNKAYLEYDFVFSNQDEQNPLFYIDEELLINWIKRGGINEQIVRTSMLIKNISLYSKNDGKYHWTKLGLFVLDNFYGNESILEEIEINLFSISRIGTYWGPLVNIFDERRVLLLQLFGEDKEEMSNWAKNLDTKMVKRVENMRKEELERDKSMQYFEY